VTDPPRSGRLTAAARRLGTRLPARCPARTAACHRATMPTPAIAAMRQPERESEQRPGGQVRDERDDRDDSRRRTARRPTPPPERAVRLDLHLAPQAHVRPELPGYAEIPRTALPRGDRADAGAGAWWPDRPARTRVGTPARAVHGSPRPGRDSSARRRHVLPAAIEQAPAPAGPGREHDGCALPPPGAPHPGQSRGPTLGPASWRRHRRRSQPPG